ncbi:hypothetical protein IV64_GL001722 [Lactiplantibacillus xiangfangensis]|uniref:Phage tail protein n=1 Tax=Lactiplantibacillus xiangfangensis TaxID=942150 RepID=A0A0R2MKJ7_9LACO|nr:DUF806 family protein [Lactiplantibacillus xiangfangensis]KRO14238.1 hypothetical protein IV64_GL001722 [Lactiplantibacillus xiangfangensis]
MELPVVTMAKVINSFSLPWLDNVFRGSIPPAYLEKTDNTTMLITESMNEPQVSLNGRHKGWLMGTELQIFYKVGAQFNTQDAEIDLTSRLEQLGYKTETRARVKDPDTNQVTKVLFATWDLLGGTGNET